MPSPRTLVRGGVVLLVASVLFAFWGSLDGLFVWDDRSLLLEHGLWVGFTRSSLAYAFTTNHMGHWQPLTWLSWSFDHARGGIDPSGYHATNLVLHAANAVLVFALGRKLLARALPERSETSVVLGALLAAVLFAVHPLRVESVAWITERRDLLSSLFLFGTVLAWWRAREGEGLARGWYAFALVLFALSLASKAWGLTLPAVLVVLAWWPLGVLRRGTLGREALLVAPFAALAAGCAWLAVWAQAGAGAMRFAEEMTVLQRSAQAAAGLLWYPWKTLAPTCLQPLVLLDPELDAFAPRHLAAFGGVAALTLGALAFVRRSPAPLVAWLVFGILVSPVLGFAQSGAQAVADRYSYLSMIAPVVLVAGALVRLVPARALAALAVASGVGLSLATRAQVAHWSDDVALWTRAIECSTDHYLAYSNRGEARFTRGDHAGARADFDRALEIRPEFATAWYQRGYLKAAAPPVDWEAALADFRRSLELDPAFGRAWGNLGGMLVGLTRYEEALVPLDNALKFGERPPEIQHLRGIAFSGLGRKDEAIRALEEALRAAPPGWAAEREVRAMLQRLR